MATFYNQATLSYNGISTVSNITTGEIVDLLSVTKAALSDVYTASGCVVYAVSIVNAGTTALSGLTLTDNLGAYTVTGGSAVPLTYRDGAIRYYVNGVLQTAPTVAETSPLTLTGIRVPAGGNALVLYETLVNQFAPLDADGQIDNTVTVTGQGISTSVSATATVSADAEPLLSISKSLSPAVVSESGQITYTFLIENRGNSAADAADAVSVTDVFTPVLNAVSVAFNGTAWTLGTQYTYDTATGVFSTVAGQITVPAATFDQDAQTGEWTVSPGTAVLTVTGTV